MIELCNTSVWEIRVHFHFSINMSMGNKFTFVSAQCPLSAYILIRLIIVIILTSYAFLLFNVCYYLIFLPLYR